MGRNVSSEAPDCSDDDDFSGRFTDAERAVSVMAGPLPLAVGCIWPLAAVSLFVKEEIAHPAQDVSLDVPMRAALLLLAPWAFCGGSAVSGIVLLYFRMRCKYRSIVLFA